MKTIVHADDFGLSEKVNEGILRAHTHGILTSTSIMANGAAFEHAISLWQSTPTLDVGIHLILVEEQPLLGTDMVPSLVNREGRFYRHAVQFTKRYLMGRISLREVRRELEAQIVKVIGRGVSISHLDSHQHLHMLPKILQIVVDLAKEYDIPAIRFPCEVVYIDMLREGGSASKVLQLLALNFLCRLGRNASVLRTDQFAGFLFGGNLHKKNLKKMLQQLPLTGTCELMCHPGFDDPDTRYNHWGYHWSHELSALVAPEIPDFLERKGIHLISYRQLADL